MPGTPAYRECGLPPDADPLFNNNTVFLLRGTDDYGAVQRIKDLAHRLNRELKGCTKKKRKKRKNGAVCVVRLRPHADRGRNRSAGAGEAGGPPGRSAGQKLFGYSPRAYSGRRRRGSLFSSTRASSCAILSFSRGSHPRMLR